MKKRQRAVKREGGGGGGRLTRAETFVDPARFDSTITAILAHNAAKYKDLVSADGDWTVDEPVRAEMLTMTEQLAGRLMQRASWFASYRTSETKKGKAGMIVTLDDIEMAWKALLKEAHQ